MRIAISTNAIFGDELNLGISNTINLIARHMAEKYHADITAFTPEVRGYPNVEEFDDIRIERYPFKRFMTDWTIAPAMITQMKKRNFDIIHSFYYGYFPVTAGFLASRWKSIPHMITPTYHPTQSTPLKISMMRLYNFTHGRFILRGSAKVLPYNKDEESHLRKITSFDSEIIPCPINNDVFYPSPKKRGDETTLLFIGNLAPWKGADTAFKICRELEKKYENLRFVFIGSGLLEDYMKKHATKRFIFLKNLALAELGKQARNADIFLYPTKYESFGRVVAEAEMSGLPVITTRVGAVPETAGDGGLIVDYGDWEKMKKYAQMLIEDPGLRKEISRRAINHSEQFKYREVASRIYRLYEEALE